MKVLLTGLGSAGDVFPMLGLGRRLLERGHQVVVIAPAYFGPSAERLGLGFEGLGTPEGFQLSLRDPDLWHPTRGFAAVMRLVLEWTEPVYQMLARQYEPGRTVVGAHVLDFAARMLQEERGFTVASLVFSPVLLRSDYEAPTFAGTANYSWLPPPAKRLAYRIADRFFIDPAVAPALNAIRARHGLNPIRRVFDRWLLSPALTVGLLPSWYAPPQPDWPASIHLTGFPLFDEAEPVPGEVEAFTRSGDPPIVVTLGSAMAHGEPLLREAAEACRRLGRRVLLLSRFSSVPDLPRSALHARFAPLSRVLPRSALLVHHGGVGTTAAALAAGIPQLVTPMSHDQPDNAWRIGRLGVGATLLPSRFTADALAPRLERLIADSRVRERAARYADRLAGSDGIGETCALLEELGGRSSGSGVG